MTGTPTRERLAQLEARKAHAVSQATEMLETRQAAGIAELSGPDAVRFRAMQQTIAELDDQITEYRSELERAQIPERYRNLGGGERRVSSAGRLSPLGHSDEQLRRAFDQVNRGETAVLKTRDPGFTSATGLVPPELFPVPISPRHENRLLERLPGHAIDVPALAYIEVLSTSGTAAVVAEGAAKPELTPRFRAGHSVAFR
jgi:hypothetical protein